MTPDVLTPSQKLLTALDVAASLLFLAVWLCGLQVDGLATPRPVHVPSTLCDLFLRDYSVDFLAENGKIFTLTLPSVC